jgi:Lrp/AsnC family leucine-responsive transcriptional regulator
MNLLKKYYSMSTLEKLDKVDLQILRTLQENARLTTKELAARVSLSSTPVFERLKRLENGGYIKKYIAVLDAEKLNQGFVVFCSVKLRRLNRDIAAEFTRSLGLVSQRPIQRYIFLYILHFPIV